MSFILFASNKLKRLFLLLISAGLPLVSIAQSYSELLSFEFEGDSLWGIFNQSDHSNIKGIVLIVHGSGRTNAVSENWYADVRNAMLNAGYSTFMWDKRGCGQSTGEFNYNQSVHNSASEVIQAINELKKQSIPGSDKIGLWGISRAGWINPLVINQYNNIKFWISVSGVDEKENFKYLLENNLLIDGLSKDSVELIVHEYINGLKISHSGGSFEEYQSATKNLNRNKFWLRFTNGGVKEESYYQFQKSFVKEKLDEPSGLQIYVDDFDSILSNIQCPVLAVFGEKDMHVDWRQSKDLYLKNLDNENLTIKTFPDCNHNIFQCKSGGFYEFQDTNMPYIRCTGFLDTMHDWLLALD